MSLSSKILSLLNVTSDTPPAPVPAEWVREMMQEHPAFILPGVLMLKRNPSALDAEELKEMKMHLLLNCSDPTALADTVDLAGEDWAHIYPPEQSAPAPSTDSAISTFLDAYGSSSDSETALLEQLIFNPAPADYFADEDLEATPGDGSLLPPELRSQASPADSGAAADASESNEDVTDVTNSATSETSTSAPNDRPDDDKSSEQQKPAQKADDSLLSESLAKIFIKQHRYERAFEIISNLSLNFPEKSVYFADQLRFLQKLIKNREYQQQK